MRSFWGFLTTKTHDMPSWRLGILGYSLDSGSVYKRSINCFQVFLVTYKVYNESSSLPPCACGGALQQPANHWASSRCNITS